jgi:hypothetical protein
MIAAACSSVPSWSGRWVTREPLGVGQPDAPLCSVRSREFLNQSLGGTVRRYATIAFRSSSVILA